MSREAAGLQGYEPGGGYRPASPSLRGFLVVLLLLAAYFTATVLLDSYLGWPAVHAFLNAVWGACFLSMGARQILNPERLEEGETEKGARRVRMWGIVTVMIGTVIGTLALRSILFLWEGW